MKIILGEYARDQTIRLTEQRSSGLTPKYVQGRVANWLAQGIFKEADIPEAVRDLRSSVHRIALEHQDYLLGD